MGYVEFKRSNEELFLKLGIAENNVFKEGISVKDFFEKFLNGTISLEIDEKYGSKIMDINAVEEIEKVLPKLFEITESPAFFIKAIEEKVPVEIAKRINYKAISHLSKDSNDWHSRTITSVKPKNILSDVNEVTINLYENRFVCQLLDLITEELYKARRHREQIITREENAYATNKKEIEYGYSIDSFKSLKKIKELKKRNNNSVSDESSYLDQLLKEKDHILDVEKKVRRLKRTDFYKNLHKEKKVKEPIQKTNILMFDQRYRKAYLLWLYLKDGESKTVMPESTIDQNLLENYYHFYTTLVIIACLCDMGFTEKSGEKIIFNNTVKLTRDLTFKRYSYSTSSKKNKKDSEDEILLSVDKDKITLKYAIDGNFSKYDVFNFYSDYANFEKYSEEDLEKKTEGLLNGLIIKENKKKTFEKIVSQYELVSINFFRFKQDFVLKENVYRRFFGIGDNFSNIERIDNLNKWSGYKTALLNISPENINTSFLKIQRIINYHILSNRHFSKESCVCPICGESKNISVKSDGSIHCHNPECKKITSITYCNHCDPKHEKPITWVIFNDDELFNDYAIMNISTNDVDHSKLERIEYLMGKYSTTAFDCVKENDKYKLKTICPFCGKILGD